MIELKNHLNCREYLEIRKICTASENGKSYRILNSSSFLIEKWKIDKCVLNDETTCDFLFVAKKIIKEKEESKQAFWIELKGSDVEQAALQILSTIKKIKMDNGCIHHARIVPSKNPNPLFRGTKYRELQSVIRKNGGTIKNQNKLLEEIL